MDEDLSAFFDGEFASEVTTDNRRTFNAIFDTPYAGVGEDVAVDSTAPSLVCRTCDLDTAGVVVGSRLTIRDLDANVDHGRFIVRALRAADVPTMTVLQLEKV